MYLRLAFKKIKQELMSDRFFILFFIGYSWFLVSHTSRELNPHSFHWGEAEKYHLNQTVQYIWLLPAAFSCLSSRGVTSENFSFIELWGKFNDYCTS